MSQQPSFAELKAQFLQAMQMRNHSERTLEKWNHTLDRFCDWCELRSITDPAQLTKHLMAAYQRYLFHYRQPRNNKPLHFRTQVSYLGSVRSWCRWMVKAQILAENPTSELEFPKLDRDLPMRMLSEEELERTFAVPDVTRPLGLRDRAMLETFYSTAIRCSELMQLNLYDVDAGRGIVTIHHGKGRKDRVVPVGARALAWIDRYIETVRPQLVEQTNELALFVSYRGRRFGRNNISGIVRGYFTRAGIQQPGSCHLFRHTAVTLMLEHGADLRSLQLLLGHVRLDTTQVYTHVSIRRLKEVHDKTHPGSRTKPDPESST